MKCWVVDIKELPPQKQEKIIEAFESDKAENLLCHCYSIIEDGEKFLVLV